MRIYKPNKIIIFFSIMKNKNNKKITKLIILKVNTIILKVCSKIKIYFKIKKIKTNNRITNYYF